MAWIEMETAVEFCLLPDPIVKDAMERKRMTKAAH